MIFWCPQLEERISSLMNSRYWIFTWTADTVTPIPRNIVRLYNVCVSAMTHVAETVAVNRLRKSISYISGSSVKQKRIIFCRFRSVPDSGVDQHYLSHKLTCTWLKWWLMIGDRLLFTFSLLLLMTDWPTTYLYTHLHVPTHILTYLTTYLSTFPSS